MKKQNGIIHITNHSGKMKGIRSISTAITCNENCLRNRKIKGSICAKCYAGRYVGMRKYLRENLERNYTNLTTRVLEDFELPTINDKIFRFESFGDLANTTQVHNYYNICEKNANTQFAIWTKNPHILLATNRKIPSNLNIMISSLMVNYENSNFECIQSKLAKLGAKKENVKLFTVYEEQFANENGIEINCGARSCITCMKCYSQNDITKLCEKLK